MSLLSCRDRVKWAIKWAILRGVYQKREPPIQSPIQSCLVGGASCSHSLGGFGTLFLINQRFRSSTMTSQFHNTVERNMNNQSLNTSLAEQSPRANRVFLGTSSGVGMSPLSPLSPSAVSRAGLATIEARMMQDLLRTRMQQNNGLGMLHQEQPNPMSPVKQCSAPTKGGLDLLGSVVHVVPPSPTKSPFKSPVGNNNTMVQQMNAMQLSPMSPTPRQQYMQPQQQQQQQQSPMMGTTMLQAPPLHQGEPGRIYINSIQEFDILCGRGGRSNHHPGNKRYRQVVSHMKMMYRQTEQKTVKTDLSRAIVEHVCNYGGRFIKKEQETGRYYILTKDEARKKTSQALRETKELKWTL